MTTATHTQGSGTDVFDDLVVSMQKHFQVELEKSGSNLFTVDAGNLYEMYLNGFPNLGERDHHTCHACEHFINTYGSLAVVNDTGELESAVWRTDGDIPTLYREVMTNLSDAIHRGRISSVFYSDKPVWGTPVTGEWTHFAIQVSSLVRFSGRSMTPFQRIASKREDFKNVMTALRDFKSDDVNTAMTILESGSLYSSEAVIGPVRFLRSLHAVGTIYQGRSRENLIWKLVAAAPDGFCHPRSSMAGSLLEDIASGLTFDQVKRNFEAKMHPLRYQRPQAAPSAGNIEAANKLMETLGVTDSLKRRFAYLDEVQKIWEPESQPDKPSSSGGVFSFLRPKGEPVRPPIVIPPQTITWVKFAASVLPDAIKIEVDLESQMNLCAFVTATDPNAKPILQWDTDEQRNSVSWYVYHGGSHPSTWSLQERTWAEVTGISYQPSMWNNGDNTHQGRSVLFALKGARDIRKSGLGLFPSILKSELRPIRSTIEAYSLSQEFTEVDPDKPLASGLRIGDNDNSNRIRVTSRTGVTQYHIDRWD